MENLYNSVASGLRDPIDNTQTTFQVLDASRFPTVSAGQYRLLCDSELMLVTGISGNTFTVERAIEQTTAVPHGANASCILIATAGAIKQYVSENAGGGDVTSVAGRTGDVTLDYTDISGLATVAHSGAYSDLSGKPSLGTIASQAANNVAITGGSITGLSSPSAGSDAATKNYVDGLVVGLWDFKGNQDCSGDPNYPSALKGDIYRVSVAGKIGGASGVSVDVGDFFTALADNAGGTQASVGTSWQVFEHNLVGALLAANNLSDLTNPGTARTNLGLGTAAVVDVGNTANKVVQLDGSGKLPALDGSQLTNLPGGGGSVIGDDTQIPVNNAGTMQGFTNLTFSPSTGTLSTGILDLASNNTASAKLSGPGTLGANEVGTRLLIDRDAFYISEAVMGVDAAGGSLLRLWFKQVANGYTTAIGFYLLGNTGVPDLIVDIQHDAVACNAPLTVTPAANHHVVFDTNTPVNNDFYLSLGFSGDIPTIYAVQQGVGGLPVKIHYGALVSSAFIIGFDGGNNPQFYDVAHSCAAMTFDMTAGLQINNTSGVTQVQLTRAGSFALWGGAAPNSQPAANAAMTDSTGGSAGTTLSACGDTSASDQSTTINDNFASIKARLDELRQMLGPTGYNMGS